MKWALITLLCTLFLALLADGVFHLLFVRTLRCEKCGEIVPEDEYRSHTYKCNQKD